LYEFYSTSSPAGSAPKDADFTDFYGFRFADINCIAYNDLCAQHKVSSWPSTILYEDGEPTVVLKGVKAMNILSAAVEEALEKVKPGTRPAKMELPEPGDETSPTPKGEKGAEGLTVQKSNAQRSDPEPAAEVAPAQPEETTSPKYIAYPFDPPQSPQKMLMPGPKSTPNPNGQSVQLTADTFERRVARTLEPWFIKFYAPWCHHCQKMAPNWEQLGKEVKGRLNIGEVNCEVESRLCKDLGVRGYPTLMFFMGSERAEYQGLRGLGDLIKYAEQAVGTAGGIQDVDAESFKALEEKEDVIFLYFYDHATTSEDFSVLERLPVSMIGRAKLVKTRDTKLFDRFKITTWPRLVVSREGRPTYFTPSTPRDMRDLGMLRNWMKSVWLPLVPELTASNAREVMDGRIVVLGMLNRANEDSFQEAIREMKSAASEWMDKQVQLFRLERQELRDAKQLRIEEAEDRNDERALRNAKNIRINMNRSDRKEVTFAWVDGAFWQRWIRTTYGIDVKDGDRVIINDEDVSDRPNP
jgi:protein disulfide-isomerase